MANLWDTAGILLAAVSQAFDRTDDPPAFRWIADGTTPVMDFGVEDSLVVMWDSVRTGLSTEGLATGGASASARGLDQASVMTGTFSVYVWRPAPAPLDSGDAPTMENITEAAERQLRDAHLVFRTLLAGFGDGTLMGDCADATILDQVPISEGGVEGSRLRIAVSLS